MRDKVSWPYINPGKKLHRITILQPGAGSDASGSVVTWTPLLSTWAEIEYVRGTDVVKSGQDTTQAFLTVKINFRPGVVSNMRVQAANGTYLIQSIENVAERNAVLVLNCIALGANE